MPGNGGRSKEKPNREEGTGRTACPKNLRKEKRKSETALTIGMEQRARKGDRWKRQNGLRRERGTQKRLEANLIAIAFWGGDQNTEVKLKAAGNYEGKSNFASRSREKNALRLHRQADFEEADACRDDE